MEAVTASCTQSETASGLFPPTGATGAFQSQTNNDFFQNPEKKIMMI